jgi:hypothetical protein
MIKSERSKSRSKYTASKNNNRQGYYKIKINTFVVGYRMSNKSTYRVNINKLAEAAASFGLAKPDIIKIGESHIPPPIPTRPEILPRRGPNVPVIRVVLVKFKFIVFIFS